MNLQARTANFVSSEDFQQRTNLPSPPTPRCCYFLPRPTSRMKRDKNRRAADVNEPIAVGTATRHGNVSPGGSQLPGAAPWPGAGPGGGGGQTAGVPPRQGTDAGGPCTARRGPRGVPPRAEADPGGHPPARSTSRGSLHVQGQIPERPHGRGQMPGWRRAEPGGLSTAGAVARPSRGRKARPPRVKPPPLAHLRSPKALRGPPRSGAPCLAPEVPPGTHGAPRRRCCRAAPPGRCCRFRFQERPRAPRRAGEGAACRPGGPRAGMRHSPGHGDRDTGHGIRGPLHWDWDKHTLHHARGSGHATLSAQGPCRFKNRGFYLPKKCCHLHTDMFPTRKEIPAVIMSVKPQVHPGH